MNGLIERDTRENAAKVRAFGELFRGLSHVYGTYDFGSGRSWQVKTPVTEKVLLDHLLGRRPYGVYLLTGETTRSAAVDFDSLDANPPREFVHRARHYGLPVYVERSKQKGFHVWMFFAREGVRAAKARMVCRHILEEMGLPRTEVFPKQDALRPGSTDYGCFINTPMNGRLVTEGRTVFVEPDGSMAPYANQWQFLENITRVTKRDLDELIEANAIKAEATATDTKPNVLGVFRLARGLPPCAQRMLEEGVTENQRVSCFRLAVHLRKVGLPFDVSVAALTAWAEKNRPSNGKRGITHEEIQAQTASAYLKEYTGCGCEEAAIAPFCDPACPISGRGGRDE